MTTDAGRHPSEDLSALLDGELDADAANAVVAHLDTCSTCPEELHWARAVRWALRSLPAVEPPPGFIEEVAAGLVGDGGGGDRATLPRATLSPDRHRARRRPRRGRVAPANVAVLVAAGVALFVLTVSATEPGPYQPQVDAAVGRHVASLSAMAAQGQVVADGGPDPLRPRVPVTPSTAPPRDLAGLPAPFRAPPALGGGYHLADAFTQHLGLQLVYERDRYGLSVFEARGQLDFAALPAGGVRLEVTGAQGWQWEAEGVAGRVVVFERDGLVVTVVGDEPGGAVLEAARSIPRPRPLSMAQRLGEAGASLLEAFSP